MEPVSEEEWSGMYSTDQEAYFIAQLLWQPNNIDNNTTSMYFSSYNGCSGSQFSLPSHESYCQSHVRSILTRNGSSITKEQSMVEGENTSSPSQVPTNYNLIEVDDLLNQDVSNDSMESGENMPIDVLQLGRDVELVRKHLQDKVLDSPPERSKQKRCRGLLEDLLSSDDLWMYAPIAYNGIDIGLNLKIGTPKS